MPRHRPRLGLDLSLLADPRAVSAARWLEPACEALRERPEVFCVDIGREARPRFPGRAVDVAQEAMRAGLDGLHVFTSGLPLGWWPPPLRSGERGMPPMVQTIHELPWLHGERGESSPGAQIWGRFGWRIAQRVVTPSEHVARQMVRHYSAPEGSVVPIPWGIDPAFFETERDRERSHPERLLLTQAGRPKKRALAALAALPHLPDGMRLALTGPAGPGIERVLERARRLGVADRVDLLGHVPDDALPKLIASSGAVLAIARSEGFGLPVAEALAAGTPVVVTAGGAAEETGRGHAIACEQPDDPRQLARAIEAALALDRAALDAGRDSARSYRWERWADDVVDLWREILRWRGWQL